MRWTLTQADTDSAPRPGQQASEESFRRNVLLAKLEDMIAWGRAHSVWPFNFGLSCCYVEMATAFTPRYDIARFGSEVIRASPRQADLIVISGTVFMKMAPVVQLLYEQLLEPRWVISMGSCANSGGMYDVYSVVQGVDKFLPVDVYVPGCPPRPDALLEGLLLLQEAIGKERRPLGRVIGEGGIADKSGLPSFRDMRTPERRLATRLREPDALVPTLRRGNAVGGACPERSRRTPASPVPPGRWSGQGCIPTQERGNEREDISRELTDRFGPNTFTYQATADGIPTLWLPKHQLREVLGFLKRDIDRPFRMLFDLSALDERPRQNRQGQSASDTTVFYQLLSPERNEFIRLKVALTGHDPHLPSVAGLWPNANWYEREAYDMFGIRFEGHPHLRRILMPPTWKGHPLRKDHPARATEMGPYSLTPQKEETEQMALRFNPEEWGMKRHSEDSDFLFLNLGPNHPSVHGVFRIALQLDGEEIVEAVPDIGYHHRGAEKMGERQSWHTYIPYTDRVDYLGGSLNNLPYVMALEKLAGIAVPDRAEIIRVMISEFYRINSHLLFYGTFAQDLGQLSPVFYMFADRERVFEIIEGITGARMHSSFFRIGGTALDLPTGWDKKVLDFCAYFLPRLDQYDKMVMANSILQRRTVGLGVYDTAQALDWGATGPGLRATGLAYDWRKARPYSGYEHFEFDIPTGQNGDCYDRCAVRVEEMRQSVRILRQCVAHMPSGPFKADHPLTTPPPKARTMHDIETLIQHFLNVSWGPVMPVGETFACVEATKGLNGYTLTSDGGSISYRTRIRTPSFPHLQMIPMLCRGLMVADLIAILGSIDFVMADVDR